MDSRRTPETSQASPSIRRFKEHPASERAQSGGATRAASVCSWPHVAGSANGATYLAEVFSLMPSRQWLGSFDTPAPSWHSCVMNGNTAPLRQRQAQQVRIALLEAAISQLEGSIRSDVSMAEVAQAAGVSLRTLYRYFPDRASLLDAAGDHLYRSLGVPFEIAGPEDIAASFREAARRLGARPQLTRALVRSEPGKLSRSAVRQQRLEAIRGALKPLTDSLDPCTAQYASAVIAHLCSAASWVSIADECGVDDSDAQEAVCWAIDALMATLRKKDRRLRPRSNRRQATRIRRTPP